jgi:nitroreductase
MDDPVFSRHSIRKYTDEPVTDEQVDLLLRAAMAAPSAGNQQPWHFVVLRDVQTFRAVQDWHPYAAMLPTASVAIVVCGDPRGCKWPQMWEQDCSAATENILIEAAFLGLGAVWLGVHPLEERIRGGRELLGVPEHVVPFAIVAVGHPHEQKPPSDRYDAARVHRDRW